jgi:hypothetical protein
MQYIVKQFSKYPLDAAFKKMKKIHNILQDELFYVLLRNLLNTK